MTQADAHLASRMHVEAVEHAKAAQKAAGFAWQHLAMEYTQDIENVLGTLATAAPLAWTMPNTLFSEGGGGLTYTCATTLEEIRAQYENMRQYVEIWGWDALTEIRQGWYVLTHGVATMKSVQTGEEQPIESVTMFPIGDDGILGEVQIGDIGHERENRWPEVPTRPGEIPLPHKRLEVRALHDRYVDALRSGDVDTIVQLHREETAATLRSYDQDISSMANVTGHVGLRDYWERFFARFSVHDVELVNRVAESWFVFAELLWTVEYRGGEEAGRIVNFCTADTAPIDASGRFWIRTGAGTDPVPAR